MIKAEVFYQSRLSKASRIGAILSILIVGSMVYAAEIVIPSGIYKAPAGGIDLKGLIDAPVKADGGSLLESDPKSTALWIVGSMIQPSEIVIPPGTYRTPAGGIKLTGLRDVHIKADGVTLLATNPKSTALSFENCTNVTLQGLTVDYDPLPFTQGTLTSIDKQARTADFKIHTGYPDLAEKCLIKKMHVFEKTEPRWKVGAFDFYVDHIERLAPRSGRIFFRETESGLGCLEPGDRVAFDERTSSAVYIGSQCSQVNLKDVTLYTSPGVGVMIRFAETAGTFEHVRVVPGPKPQGATEERLLSSCADAFNAAYTRSGPILDGCEFAYMGDDSVNLHGVILPVLVWEDSRTYLSMRPQAGDTFHQLLRPGDEVRFLSEPDYRLVETAKIAEILKAETPTNLNWRVKKNRVWPAFEKNDGATFYRVRLDREVILDTQGLFFEVPASAAPGYVIRNCYFHDHRGRGLRIMAGNGLVESNRFERIKGSAMSFGAEFAFWREAGWVNDIMVRGNTIQDVGLGAEILSLESYTLGAISVFARVLPKLGKSTYYPGNQHLSFIGNSIDGCSLGGIYVNAAQDVRIESNTIRRVNLKTAPSAGRKHSLKSGQPISAQNSESVVVTNNCIN